RLLLRPIHAANPARARSATLSCRSLRNPTPSQKGALLRAFSFQNPTQNPRPTPHENGVPCAQERWPHTLVSSVKGEPCVMQPGSADYFFLPRFSPPYASCRRSRKRIQRRALPSTMSTLRRR